MSGGVLDENKKSVCFICGSYTSQTINIYEKRAGPNIVDIINEKFKVQVSRIGIFYLTTYTLYRL